MTSGECGLHPIYKEMIERNHLYLLQNPCDYDELLDTKEDRRRCIALVADGEWEFFTNYEQSLDYIGSELDKTTYKVPHIHHTFLMARPMEGVEYELSVDEIDELEDAIKLFVKPYRVIFDTLVAVRTGLAVVGGHDILNRVNKMRELFRHLSLVYGERYKMDILHFTAFRWNRKIDENTRRQFLSKVAERRTNGPFARLNVTKIKIVEASWLLHPHECRVLREVRLTK